MSLDLSVVCYTCMQYEYTGKLRDYVQVIQLLG